MLWNKLYRLDTRSTLCYCIKIQHTWRFLQKKLAAISWLLLSSRLTNLQCNEIVLERGAWQGWRHRFKSINGWNELKYCCADAASRDGFSECGPTLLCVIWCVCLCVQGFYVFQQGDRAVCHPVYGLWPLGSQENPAFPLRGGTAVTSKFTSTQEPTVFPIIYCSGSS